MGLARWPVSSFESAERSMPVSSVRSARLRPFASRAAFSCRSKLLQLVEGRHPFVVARDQVGQFLGDLLSNRLVLGSFFRS